MAQIEVIVPKMGESIVEATILKWLKKEGDTVELDETLLEVATDKVDSEVPSTAKGTLVRILAQVNEVVAIGKAIAIIETDANTAISNPEVKLTISVQEAPVTTNIANTNQDLSTSISDKFYSPLVKNIAKQENISLQELDQIQGTGANGRLTKRDIVSYIENNESKAPIVNTIPSPVTPPPVQASAVASISGKTDIIERKGKRCISKKIQSKINFHSNIC